MKPFSLKTGRVILVSNRKSQTRNFNIPSGKEIFDSVVSPNEAVKLASKTVLSYVRHKGLKNKDLSIRKFARKMITQIDQIFQTGETIRSAPIKNAKQYYDLAQQGKIENKPSETRMKLLIYHTLSKNLLRPRSSEFSQNLRCVPLMAIPLKL